MRILSKETDRIQNPALGAMLLWRFVVGFEHGSGNANSTPVPLLFIVLPMILHSDTQELIQRTLVGSGLRVMSMKFSEAKERKSDLLLAIQSRALSMRPLTSESISIAIASKLISISHEDGYAISLSSSPAKAGIPKQVQVMLKSAEKLGVWCSQISLHEISVILKVEF